MTARMRVWMTTKRVCIGGFSGTWHIIARITGGYHPVKVGERFHNGKYVVLRKLGWGHFSTVWLVEDTTNGQHGALKVARGCSVIWEPRRHLNHISGAKECVAIHRGCPGRDSAAD